MAMQCILLGIWEFSYSNTFAVHVYMFIVGFKLSQVRNRVSAALQYVYNVCRMGFNL